MWLDVFTQAREQARRETQQWVMRRLPTADSIVEIGEKVGHELKCRDIPVIESIVPVRHGSVLATSPGTSVVDVVLIDGASRQPVARVVRARLRPVVSLT